ncbi:DUF4153 domain-containing protein [Olivibacter sp. SDN3]|uniref:DUF4153 domain-containing protein n=1 Tax=Olivibacter sp. SDN3 TaxID=2764720 RepID=UPI001651351A|nr:DUF4153 domain-containing protein [Olivibacter sp. SDN3]QNL51222.1 DUF4153 domain-containing protein [Olivibacter sp. SDN3]
MKIPSPSRLLRATMGVFSRFPLQAALIVLATIAALLFVEVAYDNRTLSYQLVKFLALTNISFTWLLAADLYAEAASLGAKKRALLSVAIVMLCGILFWVLNPMYYKADLYRIALLSIGGHLLVSIAPFVRDKSVPAFWTFNKTLFLRFITAALYAFILFFGLVIALSAIDKLFSVKLDEKYYQRLFSLIAIGFNSLFFLAGIPSASRITSRQTSGYPRSLKIFTQYVLIPLMSIYLLILLIYELKIMIKWELPDGMVSTLIIGYAFFGVLSLLLVFPIRDTAENTWISLFVRLFYLMMIPLLALLILAIYKRVAAYGITEPRYFLIAIALWLSGITAYFLISKRQDIRLIPISLCLFAFGMVYGPQSASKISLRSQVNRLKALMEEGAGERDGTTQISILQYLISTHGLSSIQSFTDKDLKSIEKTIETKNNNSSSYDVIKHKLDSAYAILHIDPSTASPEAKSYTVFSDEEQVISVTSWDFLIKLDTYQQEVATRLAGDSIRIIPDNRKHSCEIIIASEQHIFDLSELLQEIEADYKSNKLIAKMPNNRHFYYPKKKMQMTMQVKGYEVCLSLNSIYIDHYRSKDDEAADYFINFSANILLREAAAK